MAKLEMADLLDLVLEEGASDLHLPCFSPPTLRLHGELTPLDVPPMQPEDTEYLMKSITSEANQQKLQQDGTVDFGFAFGDKARFRVSAFRARGNIALVLRTISNNLLTLEQIGLPMACKDILFRPRGLVLVTGPTGSGKSTTLASMIDVINHERSDHIITIEDPIEFLHTSQRSLVNQRQVGRDARSFNDALVEALRQDPDVILVGEIRDLETMRTAIRAAETGHLVFTTLHAGDCAGAIERFVGVFPPDEQNSVRHQLAMVLRGILAQHLVPSTDGSRRWAVTELLVNTPGIANQIATGRTSQIPSAIETGGNLGMRSLEDSLATLLRRGCITERAALAITRNPETLRRRLYAE